MTAIEKVNEFMLVMGQEMPNKPSPQSTDIAILRSNLINEENKELFEANLDNNIIEIADALCDLRYVVEGAFTAYGFSPELANELFAEVHRSNMSKVCHTQEEAEKTVDNLVYKDDSTGLDIPEEYSMKQVDQYWIVSRVSDNKVMKSINFSQPDLSSILQKHGVQI